jgi:hypothetical protein
VWLLRYGYTDDEIEAAFVANSSGIGEKYEEMASDAHRWMTRTIAAAREVA